MDYFLYWLIPFLWFVCRLTPQTSTPLQSISGKKTVSKLREKNLIEERIQTNAAVLTIQSAVRSKQATRKVAVMREEKNVLKEQLELYTVKGDLPADHARTIRTEGTHIYILSYKLTQ